MQDRHDDNDRPFSGMRVGLARSASLRQFSHAVFDQLTTESCTGQAIAHAAHVALRTAGAKHVPVFSSLFPYWNGRRYAGLQNEDDGAFIRDVIRGSNAHGLCPAVGWPFDPLRVNRKPGWLARRDAIDLAGKLLGDLPRPLSYRRIPPGDVAAVRAAISSGEPVVFGTRVSRRFADSGTEMAMPQDLEEYGVAGAHAMVALEYDGNVVRGPNSWGLWGKGGWFEMHETYVDEWVDIWAIRAALVGQ